MIVVSWWEVVLWFVAILLIVFGSLRWTHERYAPEIPVGALCVAVGACLMVAVLASVFGDWLMDNVPLGSRGWAQLSWVRWVLLLFALVAVGIFSFLWRVKRHKKKVAASSSMGSP